MEFPKRFEVENQNPYECPVRVVFQGGVKTYANITEAAKDFVLEKMAGPFADGKDANGKLFVRFETWDVYEILSN